MKTFYGVMISCFLLGMAIVSFHAPWTASLSGSGAPSPIGYAPIWSGTFANIPGAHVERSALGILTAIVAFFSIVIGGSAYFFRGKRTGEKDLE
jgi:hypothetical protein